MKAICIITITVFLLSCNTNVSNSNSEDSVVLNYKNIPVDRTMVNPNPVKTYSETIKSFETTDEFKVAVYETKKTFHYLIKITYKNLNEEDTLKIPNFGVKPVVEIIKGDKRPSCIVGFLDEKKLFRESKLIYFDKNKLKVHVLKHYAVSAYQDSVK